MIQEIFQGFCMALADSVPGVSGGSIAFIMGFYKKFITSLNHPFENRHFLIQLGIGWVIGMTCSVFILSSVFETHIYAISSLFLGFICFAILLLFLQNKTLLNKNKKALIFMILSILLVVGISYLNTKNHAIVDLTKLSPPTMIYIFLSGAIAISAMVLPGLSGSTLLLILGLYLPIIQEIKNILTFDFSNILALLIFGAGVLFGIVFFVRFVKICLVRFYVQTLYAIIGLMIGSLYAIILGPTTLKMPQSAMNLETFQIVFFLTGSILVILLEIYRRKTK